MSKDNSTKTNTRNSKKGETVGLEWETAIEALETLRGKKRYDLELLLASGFYTGYRMSELLKFKYGDFSEDKTHLEFIEDKSRRQALPERNKIDKDGKVIGKIRAQKAYAGTIRRVKIYKGIRDIVTTCKKLLNKQDSDFLFASPNDKNKHVSKQAFSTWLKEACKIAGIKTQRNSTHLLRKTAGLHYYEAQRATYGDFRALELTCKFLGHSTVEMTRRYLNADRKAVDEIAEKAFEM